jgi:hypothetical protein
MRNRGLGEDRIRILPIGGQAVILGLPDAGALAVPP